MTDVSLGTGVLTWTRKERVTDRYGAVYLMAEGNNSVSEMFSIGADLPSLIDYLQAAALVGIMGALVVDVKIARDSTHIGDLFRGVEPRRPEVGQRIVLGEGRFFLEPLGFAPGIAVGVMPSDVRAVPWLIPRSLYDAHEQSVELIFQRK